MKIHPNLLKYVTEKVLCPFCSNSMGYSHDEQVFYYCSCENLTSISDDLSKVYDLTCSVFKFQIKDLIITINFGKNILTINQRTLEDQTPGINLVSYQKRLLTFTSIPPDLELNQEYFDKKIPLWLTFS